MRDFQIKSGLKRLALGDFQLPLGVDRLDIEPPVEGYTLEFTPGEDGDPDTYAYQVVVSHERIQPLIWELFTLLPSEVNPVIEIGSVDAYRSIDVYVSGEPLFIDKFRETWKGFEKILLEEVSIGAGVTAEEPFLEIFIDAWKSITVHCPTELRADIETILEKHGVSEVPETWPETTFDEFDPPYRMREILTIEDEHSPDLDELLLILREKWYLELNVNRDSNVDEAGRELGHTLWHAIAMADPVDPTGVQGAYITVWATAASLEETERMVEQIVEETGEWVMSGMYSIERVAFDERPDELQDLPPRRMEPGVHLVAMDEWGANGATPGDGAGPGGGDAGEDDWRMPGGRFSNE